jgi:DNA-directed RNA polymerase subunit RPC12/RpoP
MGRTGYSPACANEWAQGICKKPRIKCPQCPHRRFFPVTDDVIRWHLCGQDDNSRDFAMSDLNIKSVARDQRNTGQSLSATFQGDVDSAKTHSRGNSTRQATDFTNSQMTKSETRQYQAQTGGTSLRHLLWFVLRQIVQSGISTVNNDWTIMLKVDDDGWD